MEESSPERHSHEDCGDELEYEDEFAVPDAPEETSSMSTKSARANLRDNLRSLSIKDSAASQNLLLPDGWQECDDDNGAYYWHVKTGTIQRDWPDSEPAPLPASSPSIATSTGPFSSGHSLASLLQSDLLLPLSFAVRSLGWRPLSEEDLKVESSNRAVNKCISDLASGRTLNDNFGRSKEGFDLTLTIDEQTLSLVNDNDGVTLTVQPVDQVKVWGVGRDDPNDFAYVSRGSKTSGGRQYECHVFHCERSAKELASCLFYVSQRVLNEQQRAERARTHSLPSSQDTSKTGFPTPMEEPRKVVRCHYIGSIPSPSHGGVEILNECIGLIQIQNPVEKWRMCSVSVAPSIVSVRDDTNSELLVDARVRYISFMAIAREDVRVMGLIIHEPDNTFTCHALFCEPSVGALCKTVEAACKLRFQKVLDQQQVVDEPEPSVKRSISAKLSGLFEAVKSKASVLSSG